MEMLEYKKPGQGKGSAVLHCKIFLIQYIREFGRVRVEGHI
jgi:hypothetical protein